MLNNVCRVRGREEGVHVCVCNNAVMEEINRQGSASLAAQHIAILSMVISVISTCDNKALSHTEGKQAIGCYPLILKRKKERERERERGQPCLLL